MICGGQILISWVRGNHESANHECAAANQTLPTETAANVCLTRDALCFGC